RHVIDAIPDELEPIPETAALLRRLHASGRRLFFLSNMPVPYARHIEASHAVLELFERGVFSSRVGSIKPEPALFAHAAAAFGVDAAQLVLIDDIAANVEAARHAGWHGLLFENARRCEADLLRLGLS
ncbi:MAG TPA: HAD-IA family hydrolase, partial [Caldimonas sp.]